MATVLLVTLEPISYRDKHLTNIVEKEKYNVRITNERFGFSTVNEYYEGSEEFNEKIEEINKSLEIEYGGHAVAVDQFPRDKYVNGAKIVDWSGIRRIKTTFDINPLQYEVIILLCPDFERIVLADINFAYYGRDAFISSVGHIVFGNETVLSVRTVWGEYKGIALQNYNELALDPVYQKRQGYYAMRFERRGIPDAVLNTYLQNNLSME